MSLSCSLSPSFCDSTASHMPFTLQPGRFTRPKASAHVFTSTSTITPSMKLLVAAAFTNQFTRIGHSSSVSPIHCLLEEHKRPPFALLGSSSFLLLPPTHTASEHFRLKTLTTTTTLGFEHRTLPHKTANQPPLSNRRLCPKH